MTTTNNGSSEFKLTLIIISTSSIGFCMGAFGNLGYFLPEKPPQPEITPIIKFTKIEDDQLFFETIGNVDILWPGAKNKPQPEGIPLGQIPTKNDLELRKFSYLGNAKTKKFYPTYTYPARGTEVKYRRFFQTKQEAIEAGFMASKLVR